MRLTVSGARFPVAPRTLAVAAPAAKVHRPRPAKALAAVPDLRAALEASQAALKAANERIAVLEKRSATQERAIKVATDLAQAGARKIAAMRKQRA